MKRYDLESTGWDHEEMVERPLGDWCEWDEVDTERAKDREEINRLKLDNGILVDWCKEKDSEITRLKIEQTGDFATACLKTKIQKQCDQLDVAKKALEDVENWPWETNIEVSEVIRIVCEASSRIAELEGK